MNNKGFAITGILYTLFILFTTLTLTILASLSYKKFVLEKTVLGLENSFSMDEILNIKDASKVTSSRKTSFKGKYVFETLYGTGMRCTVYLEKGEIIPTEVGGAFTLIPNHCNNLKNGSNGFELKLDINPLEPNKNETSLDYLILVEAYKIKE